MLLNTQQNSKVNWKQENINYRYYYVKISSSLVARLAKQGFSLHRLHHAFKKLYCRNQDRIRKYDKSMSAIAKYILRV